MAQIVDHRNQDATLYVGDLDPKVNESLLWELFLQAAPVAGVHIPKDKLSGEHQGFGFVEFHTESDAEYASKIMNMIKLYGRPLRVNKASNDKKVFFFLFFSFSFFFSFLFLSFFFFLLSSFFFLLSSFFFLLSSFFTEERLKEG